MDGSEPTAILIDGQLMTLCPTCHAKPLSIPVCLQCRGIPPADGRVCPHCHGERATERQVCPTCDGRGVTLIVSGGESGPWSDSLICQGCYNVPAERKDCRVCRGTGRMHVAMPTAAHVAEMTACPCAASPAFDAKLGAVPGCPLCTTAGETRGIIPKDLRRYLDICGYDLLVNNLDALALFAPNERPKDATEVRGLPLAAALAQWPHGVVNESNTFIRYYVEPHTRTHPQHVGQVVLDIDLPVEDRRYDVWGQSKRAPLGRIERDSRLLNGIWRDVQNTLSHAQSIDPAAWRSAQRGAP